MLGTLIMLFTGSIFYYLLRPPISYKPARKQAIDQLVTLTEKSLYTEAKVNG